MVVCGRLVLQMEEGAFSSDEDLILMLLNNFRKMMRPLTMEPNVWDALLCICVLFTTAVGNVTEGQTATALLFT